MAAYLEKFKQKIIEAQFDEWLVKKGFDKIKSDPTIIETLKQLFLSRFNCYADAEEVTPAMDQDCFVKTVNDFMMGRLFDEQQKNEHDLQFLKKMQENFNDPYDLTRLRDATEMIQDWIDELEKKLNQ